MWHVWGAEVIHRGFWWRYLMEEDHLEDTVVDVRVILKLIFKK